MGFTDDRPMPLADTGLSSSAFAAGLGGGPNDRGPAGICLTEDS